MTKEKINELAKKLTENIENGVIHRKIDSFSTDCNYYDEAVEELCLFKYKRYIGSLRCMLDTQNMREAIKVNGQDSTSFVKTLKKLK